MTMKMKILRDTQGDGRDLAAGAVEELSDATGRALLYAGKAIKAEEPEQAPAEPETPAPIEAPAQAEDAAPAEEPAAQAAPKKSGKGGKKK